MLWSTERLPAPCGSCAQPLPLGDHHSARRPWTPRRMTGMDGCIGGKAGALGLGEQGSFSVKYLDGP